MSEICRYITSGPMAPLPGLRSPVDERIPQRVVLESDYDALAARVAELEKDAERLFYVCNGFDGFDGMDFHEVASEVNVRRGGYGEATKDDYLAAYREVIDVMLTRSPDADSGSHK